MFESFKTPIRKVISRIIEADAINISTGILHQKTFLQFKNCCEGKEVVVCGAGPSLQQYIPIQGAVHIAVNRAFLYDKIDFDYVFSQDFEGLYMVQQELADYRPGQCVKLLGTQYGIPQKEIPESFAIKCKALRFNTDLHIYGDGYKSKFVRDIDRQPLGNMPNVGLSAMQFALFMNPDRIYIVGCDMSGGHFVNINQSDKEVNKMNKKLEKTWFENYERLLVKWKELKDFAGRFYPETEIVSINPVGLKNIFLDIYQNRE